MLAALDVDYRLDHAMAACVLFADVTDAAPSAEAVARVPISAAYQSGELYKRELPALLAVLAQVKTPLSTLFVDGHVWLGPIDTGKPLGTVSGQAPRLAPLDSPYRPGLGAHLHLALGCAVIGVAKRSFLGAPSLPVLRGKSLVPLHVTAVGMDAQLAADWVRRMHGPHRLPTLLKRVDRLARDTI